MATYVDFFSTIKRTMGGYSEPVTYNGTTYPLDPNWQMFTTNYDNVLEVFFRGGAAVASALGVAYTAVILPSSTLTTPKTTWTTNPLTISFAATDASGSATDTFSCSPSAGAITLRTISNSPGIIAITIVPASFSSCGSSLLQVTVVATCQVSASQCIGSYTGLVQVRQPANYRDLPVNLQVKITVG